MKTIHKWQQKKALAEKISVITCYDAAMAKIIAHTDIDAVLVGDSLVQVIYGEDSTLGADVRMMTRHCQAVAKVLKNKFIIGDLPFLSYRKSLSETMSAVEALMRTGIHAIKLEGRDGNEQIIEHIVMSGVPVMGHIGLTPQSVHQLGGYRVQGRTAAMRKKLIEDAQALEAAGCFAIVLECVPSELAKAIAKECRIPIIGIGAGVAVDGQVLVCHDVLGLLNDFSPKFVKRYVSGFELFQQALNDYHREVKTGDFPSLKHSFTE